MKPASPDTARVEHVEGRGGLSYLLAAPEHTRTVGLLAVVHGQGRDADLLARAFTSAATDAGFAVVAPVFDRARFPAYHLLRGDGRLLGAVDAFEAICANAAQRTGAGERWNLLGFSAGAQFAHRYALVRPERVRRLVVASAGWYTMPDAAVAFPHGLASSTMLPGGVRQLRAFLSIPTRVLVGERDAERDALLRSDAFVDEVQGPHRIARARRWVAALHEAARRDGLPARAAFELMPRAGHSAREAVRSGALVPRTLAFVADGED